MADAGNPGRNVVSGAPPTPTVRAAFRRVPLTLSARLAAGRVRVGRLRELASGTILPLDTVVGEPSRLLAEGVVVAAGEIVDVQGRLALRLTRLGVDPHE